MASTQEREAVTAPDESSSTVAAGREATRGAGTEGEGPIVLDRYHLGRRLGAGGFGTVHEAWDDRLDRWVALKVIPADGAAPERARREAVAAARLEHPGIVAIFDAGQDEQARYLVSELVEGATLAALRAGAGLSDRDVLRIGLALCDALAHAHERGVVHRDVKPQNVLVPEEPRGWRDAAKLADFGVAHLAGDDALTVTGDVVGTLAYMAPEQAAGRRVDARADLYSLALVLYEALSGVNPVRAESPAATARRVGSVLPPLGKLRRDLPAELAQALDRALRPAPEERGTLEDLAAALARALPLADDDGGTIVRHPLERRLRGAPPRGSARAAAALAAGTGTAAALAVAAPVDPVPPVPAGIVAALLVAALPRAGWALSAMTVVALLAVGPVTGDAAPSSHGAAVPGIAVVLALALAPVPLLVRRLPAAWSLPPLAPLLGLVALAPAFVAVAGLAARWYQRAALGALGAWCLILAEPLAGRSLGLGPAEGVPPPGSFARAASVAAGDAVATTVSSGLPLLLLVWAAFAAVMPWIVRGRSAAPSLVGASAWAAGLGASSAAVAAWLAERGAIAEVRGPVAGAVAAGAIAVAGALWRQPRYSLHDQPDE